MNRPLPRYLPTTILRKISICHTRFAYNQSPKYYMWSKVKRFLLHPLTCRFPVHENNIMPFALLLKSGKGQLTFRLIGNHILKLSRWSGVYNRCDEVFFTVFLELVSVTTSRKICRLTRPLRKIKFIL